MKQTSHGTRGAAFIAASAVLMSLGGLLIKVIPWSPIAVNGGRNLFAACVTLAYMAAAHHRLRLSPAVWACAVCLALNSVLYTIAVRLTTAANAIVIEYTSPIFIMLYLWLFFRQRPRRTDVAACGVVFAGVACFFAQSLSGGGMAGNLLAVAAAATYAVVFMVNMFPGGDSLSGIFLAQVLSGLFGLPWVVREPNQSPAVWGAVAFMGVVQIGIAYVCMCRGLATTGPVAANIICMIEPVLNPVWVAVFYGERIGALGIVGIVIVLGGLLCYNVLNARRAAQAAALQTAAGAENTPGAAGKTAAAQTPSAAQTAAAKPGPQ